MASETRPIITRDQLLRIVYVEAFGNAPGQWRFRATGAATDRLDPANEDVLLISGSLETEVTLVTPLSEQPQTVGIRFYQATCDLFTVRGADGATINNRQINRQLENQLGDRVIWYTYVADANNWITL